MGAGKMGMIESAKEVYGSMRVGGENPKSLWWNDKVKAVDKIKETALKEVLEDRVKDAIERCLGLYKEEKRRYEKG